MKSLKKLASELGVSTATVSYVYHGKWKEKRISEVLAAKIRKALDQDGVVIRPSLIGTQLKTGRSMTIGVLLPDFETSYWLGILKGIESIMTASGLLMLLANTKQGRAEAEMLAAVTSRGVDGIIMAPYTTAECFAMTHSSVVGKVPLVFVDAYLDFKGKKIDYVVSDNRKGALELTQSLLAAGKRRIAYIGSGKLNSALQDRFNGFIEAHKIFGIRYDKSLLLDDAHATTEALSKVLSASSSPDALFVESLSYFDKGFKMLSARGLKVPQDIAIAGFDSFDWSRVNGIIEPATIHRAEQDGESMGRLAASRLKELIQNPSHLRDYPCMELFIPPKII